MFDIAKNNPQKHFPSLQILSNSFSQKITHRPKSNMIETARFIGDCLKLLENIFNSPCCTFIVSHVPINLYLKKVHAPAFVVIMFLHTKSSNISMFETKYLIMIV